MPRPDKHVFVCVQSRPEGHPRPSCAQKDCVAVADAFFQIQQDKMLFDKVQITTTGCLGPCMAGPTVLVYPEGVMYGGVTKDDVTTIFEEHLLNNKPVENLKMAKEIWS